MSSVVDKMSTAVREMVEPFRSAWSPRLCDYPNMGFDLPTALDVVWARWRCQHFDAGQGSLANVIGKRRWTRAGNVIIQVFTPLNASEVVAYDTAEIVVGAYEGRATPSGVWFRNVRVIDVNKDVEGGNNAANSAWRQKNVLIDFLYDQIH